jgi:hypothetical protein
MEKNEAIGIVQSLLDGAVKSGLFAKASDVVKYQEAVIVLSAPGSSDIKEKEATNGGSMQ